VRYLTAAEQTGNWLLATADRSPKGWFWPVQPGVGAEVDPSLGWGTAGPAMFFTEAFRTTGDERWLSAARAAAQWMDTHLDESARQWAGCGLLTGIGGWAVVLDELAAAAGDEQARDLARRVLETVAAHASADGDTAHWHDLTEMVWGTAGIGCLMLTLGADYLGPTGRGSMTWECAGRTTSSGHRSPISRPRRLTCRELPASAPRCCACTVTSPGTRGPCAGRTPRTGP